MLVLVQLVLNIVYLYSFSRLTSYASSACLAVMFLRYWHSNATSTDVSTATVLAITIIVDDVVSSENVRVGHVILTDVISLVE